MDFIVAFFSGLTAFFWPCLLPLLPGFAVFVIGTALMDLSGSRAGQPGLRLRVGRLFLFTSGFFLIFVLLGLPSTEAGRTTWLRHGFIRELCGASTVLLGFHLAGSCPSSRLFRLSRLIAPGPHGCLIWSFVVGMAFASGWSPCPGPILMSVVVFASTADNLIRGLVLLLVYAFGLALPFFPLGMVIDGLVPLGFGEKPQGRRLRLVSGWALVITGIILSFNLLGLVPPKPWGPFQG